MKRFVSLVLALLPAATLAAQGAVPPPVLAGLTPVPGFNAPSLPFTDPAQISIIKIPSDPPGIYYCALTVWNLPPNLGGQGPQQFDVVTGRYDAVNDVFTANADAAALNSAQSDFGLSLHHSGLYAVFDRLPGRPMLATRSSLNQPFQLVGRLSGVGFENFYDPALADIGGSLHLVCTRQRGIGAYPLDPVTATAGPAFEIVRASIGTRICNSSAPITDSSGEMIGLSYHEITFDFSDNDHWIAFDLSPTTPGMLLLDTPNFISNSDSIGGKWFDANIDPNYRMDSFDTVWCSGGKAAVGASMEVTANVPPAMVQPTLSSYLLVAPAFASAPVSVPGIVGQLGLDASAPFAAFAFGPHSATSGAAILNLPVPSDQSLSGLAIPAQSITIDTGSGNAYLGNTCALTIL